MAAGPMGRTRPSRAIPPLVLAVACLSVVLLAGAIVAIGGGPGPSPDRPPLPKAHGLPAIHVGDRGEYVRMTPGIDQEGFVRFEWRDGGITRDAAGAARPTMLLDLETGPDPSGHRVLSFDAASRELFAVALVTQEDGSQSQPLGLLSAESATSYTLTRFGAAGGELVCCGIINALQGRSVIIEPETSVRFHPAGLPDAPAFLPSAMGQLGTVDALLWTSPAAGAPKVWTSPESPYPLRWETDTGEVYRLTGVERGPAPIASPPASAALPPASPAPRMPWGPSEDGIDHGFPLSRAFSHALQDPHYDGLRDLRKERPEAYIQQAYYLRYERPGDTEYHEWYVLAGDGEVGLWFCVTYERQHASDLGLTVRESTAAMACPQGLPRLVPPSAASSLIPSVASVGERWTAYRSDEFAGLAPNSWGFSMACLDDACSRSETRVKAGFQQPLERRNSLGLPVAGPDHVAESRRSHLSMNEYGAVLGLEEASFREERHPLALGKTAPASAEWVPATSYATVGGWSVPMAALAGAGLMGAAAAVLWAAWPTVKGALAAPLFSRVDRPHGLENPLRRDMLSLIEATPGIHFHQIVKTLGHGRGAADHHLRKLVELGFITAQSGNGYVCYFPKGRVDRRVMVAAPMLKAPGARAILQRLSVAPVSSATELSRATGLDAGTISYHLKRLAAAELVTVDRSRKEHRILATPLGVETLALPLGSEAT